MVKRILIVDDERHVRTLLAHALDDFEDHDVEIVDAATAREAILCAETSPVSLAFVDVSLPDMNGYELCARLRSAQPNTALHFVLLADLGLRPDADRMADASISDFVSKPFNPDGIRALAARILNIPVEV